MRLSELNTDEGLDVLCEITPYIANISADTELLDELKKKIKLPEGAPKSEIYAVGAAKLAKITPIILKKRRQDVYGILGAMNRKTPEEIADQSFITTAKQITELISDKDFMSFFGSLSGSTKGA